MHRIPKAPHERAGAHLWIRFEPLHHETFAPLTDRGVWPFASARRAGRLVCGAAPAAGLAAFVPRQPALAASLVHPLIE